MRWFVPLALLLAAACTPPRPKPADEAALKPVGAHDETRINEVYRQRTGPGGAADYCLGPGDLLTVNVFAWDAMKDQQVRVSSSGAISLPMLGDIPAAGKTENELREEIEQKLRNGYMRDPHVTVFVQRFQSQQVSVTGAVARPGLYSLSRDSRTIYDLLSQAGGMTEQAGGRVLFSPSADASRCDGAAHAPAPRPTAGVQQASAKTPDAGGLAPIEFELDAPVSPGSPNPLTIPVAGGDSIVVTRGRFMVDGWVAKPGLYSFTPGMTAYGAMSVAGGALYPADLKNAEIVRANRDGTKEVLHVNLAAVGRGEGKDIALREGDVVTFNASAIRMVPYSIYWTFNNLFRVGAGVSVAGV
jgi:polysaccharide export outer membrane protein